MKMCIIDIPVISDCNVIYICKRDYIRNARKKRRIRIFKFLVSILVFLAIITTISAMADAKADHADTTSEEVEIVPLDLQTTAAPDMISSIIPVLEQLSCEEENVVPGVHSAEFTATAYCSCERCCGKWAKDRNGPVVGAAGVPLIPDVSVAVDNSLFKFGTVFTDPQGHEFIAADTGSGVDGYWIDIYMEDHEAASAWGLQKVVLTW